MFITQLTLGAKEFINQIASIEGIVLYCRIVFDEFNFDATEPLAFRAIPLQNLWTKLCDGNENVNLLYSIYIT